MIVQLDQEASKKKAHVTPFAIFKFFKFQVSSKRITHVGFLDELMLLVV